LHKGEHFHTEVLQYHRYGKPIWVEGNVITLRDSTGEVIGFVSVNRDITERKRMEEALRESEEKFSAAFRASPIGLVIATLDGKYVEVNQALCDLLGYSREELLGKTAVEVGIFSADTRQAWVEALEREEGAMTNRELSFQLRNGISRTTLSSVETITLHGIPHRLSTVLDITERKRAEEEIRRYVTRMEVLAEISRTFVEVGLDYQSVLNTVARRTAELIGDSCVITLFSDDAQRSFPVAFHHPNPVALSLMQEALLHTWQGGTDTQRYQTLLAGNSIYIPSVNPEEFRASLEPEFRTYFEAVGISSVLIVPLKTHSRVIGTLGITRDHQGNPYTREDLTLLQNIADRAAISIQNAQLFRQVEGAREQLGALSRRLLEVQESERRALTTELHDRVGQNLTGLSINLQNLKALLSDEMAKTLAAKFDDAQTLVEHTTRQIRDIMAELHPPELEDYGLAVALETYAERAASRGNLELIADLPDLAPPPLPSDVSIALFRAAQEAISNVIKHANATQLEVSLEERDDRIRLRVGDDGRGFEPDAASQKEVQTWGLKIMRERIESIGGKVQIESERGEGTRVIFEIERPS
jgi:PAS domain S-box-containing protein